MTLQDFGEGIIYLGLIAGALAAIGGLLRFVVVRPLKRWVAEQSAPSNKASQQAAKELSPNGGSSTRDVLDGIATSLEALRAQVTDNTGVAKEALTVARDTSARLDKHLADHGMDQR